MLIVKNVKLKSKTNPLDTGRTLNVYMTFRRRPRCYAKWVFLKVSQNSQENTCDRVSFLIKLQAQAWNLIKKETLEQVF